MQEENLCTQEIIKEESKDIAKTGSETLLQMAIQKDLDIEKLKLFMDLRDREEEKVSEKMFASRFAEMQKDYIPAIKNKDVQTRSGKHAYSYCPLPEILLVYSPILARHGFSYSWDEKTLENSEKRITCTLSGYGHSKSTSIDLPIAPKNDFTNAIQSRGSTTEYGRRYTFMNITGCIIADEDSSGILPGENEEDIEKLKKETNASLSFIPGPLRDYYAGKINEAKKDEIQELHKIIIDLRGRCQKIIKTANYFGGESEKKKILIGIKESKTMNEIVDWEVYVDDLRNNSTGNA